MNNLMSQSELDTVLSQIDLDGFKEEVKIKNETRGRKPRIVNNYWRDCLSDVSYSDLNQWVDDILTGAGRLDTGNSRVSGEMIFALLKGVPSITTAQIKSFLNRKRIVTGDFVDSDRYCQWLVSVLISAMKSLDYHTEQGKRIAKPYQIDTNFNVKEDALNYEQYGKNWSNQGSGI